MLAYLGYCNNNIDHLYIFIYLSKYTTVLISRFASTKHAVNWVSFLRKAACGMEYVFTKTDTHNSWMNLCCKGQFASPHCTVTSISANIHMINTVWYMTRIIPIPNNTRMCNLACQDTMLFKSNDSNIITNITEIYTTLIMAMSCSWLSHCYTGWN